MPARFSSLEQPRLTGQVELLLALTQQRQPYQCPGEELPISSAVHQARLRSNYQKCRTCPHREDARLFSAETRTHLAEIWDEKQSAAPPLRDGFQGVQWNELNLQDIRRICTAVCQRLFRETTRNRPQGTGQRITLVMGHDSRVSSLEVIQQAIRAVCEYGGRVIDIGEVSAPCFRFAVEHLEADAGIHATSADCPGTQIGLDVYQSGGLPLSGESLYALKPTDSHADWNRCGRSSGRVIPFPAQKAYLGSLLKHYRQTGPLRVVYACRNDFVCQALSDLAEELPVTFVPLDRESAACTLPEIQIQQQLSSTVVESEGDLAVYIGEDGQRTVFYEETGRKLSPAHVLQLLLSHSGELPAEQVLLLGEEFQIQKPGWLDEIQGVIRWRQSLREHFARGMQTAKAAAGVDVHERYWLTGNTPECDSLIVLGRLLQVLSTARLTGQSGHY